MISTFYLSILNIFLLQSNYSIIEITNNLKNISNILMEIKNANMPNNDTLYQSIFTFITVVASVAITLGSIIYQEKRRK